LKIPKSTFSQQIEKKEEIENIKTDYLIIIKEIENIFINSKAEIFYAKLDEILRIFLEEKKNISISNLTFEEIKSINLEKNIENLIKDIYFMEFNQNLNDSLDLRNNILEKLKLIIK
jgi:hypothetical protein